MCWHERALGFCKEIERINLFYLNWEKLRYTIVAGDAYSNLQARKRMHNKRPRERGEPEINIVAFPQNTGQIIVLHDAPADWLGGETLPTERPLLYALVASWARTPKGKRAGRGFNTWGESQESKGGGGQKRYDTCQNPDCGESLEFLQRANPSIRKYCSEECRQAAYAAESDEAGQAVAARIYGPNYPKVALLVARYLDIDANMKGMKFNGLDAGEFTALLDAAGIDYVIDGEIGTVTDKINLSVFVDDRGELIVAVRPWWLGWKEFHPDTAIWKHERARRPISK